MIVGPGNLYVQEAKRQLAAASGSTASPAPATCVVVLDAHADERGRFAWSRSTCSPRPSTGRPASWSRSPTNGERWTRSRGRSSACCGAPDGGRRGVRPGRGRGRPRGGRASRTSFAPEHLELIGAERRGARAARALAPAPVRRRAGATAFGDYVAGSNHVLPTGGSARFASALSTRHFRRRMAEVRIGATRVGSWRAAGAPIARGRGLRGPRRVDAGAHTRE